MGAKSNALASIIMAFRIGNFEPVKCVQMREKVLDRCVHEENHARHNHGTNCRGTGGILSPGRANRWLESACAVDDVDHPSIQPDHDELLQHREVSCQDDIIEGLHPR